jgi:pheromone shutdown protein TraB
MHVAEQSAQMVKDTIEKIHPNRVLIELDELRFKELSKSDNTQSINKKQSSNSKQKSKEFEKNPQDQKMNNYFNSTDNFIDSNHPFESKSPSISYQKESQIQSSSGDFLSQLYGIQQELGKMFHITPGKEMMSAVIVAKAKNIPIEFIDRPIQETFFRLQELNAEIMEEQEQIAEEMKTESLEKTDLKSLIKDLQNPQIVKEIIQEMQIKYPKIFQVLIQERNQFMTKRIVEIARKNPNDILLIVIGAGHVDDLIQLVQEQLK